MRRSGWKIYRADKLMTLHDAAMTRFSQWLRRSARSGYAYALGAALHWNDPGEYNRRANLRILFWAALLPLLTITGAILFSPWVLLLLLAYPVQYLRLVRWVQRTYPATPAFSYALFLVLGNWPEFYGQMLFLGRRLRGHAQTLIEYK